MNEGETACPSESEQPAVSGGQAAASGISRLDAAIGLGANLGDPRRQLRWAVSEIARHGRLLALSKLYRSAPVGGPPQPDFLNAAVRVEYDGSAAGLLDLLLEIERAAGRERRERWGPRCLDLDILWIAGLVVEQPGLCIPHPRLRERAFALQPLIDVAPEAIDPRDGSAFQRVLTEVGRSGIEALEWS